MEKTVVRVKGIVKRDDQYLLLKRWYDDRIPVPYMCEFIDGNLTFGEDPEDGMRRLIAENLSVEGSVVRPLYTWSLMVGDTYILGIAYECCVEESDAFTLPEELGDFAWVSREELEDYLDNVNVLADVLNADI